MEIVVDDTTATWSAVQHTVWMLINMLSRLEGVVSEIVLRCPDVPQAARIVPLADRSARFVEAVQQGARVIDTVPVSTRSADDAHYRLVVGPGAAVQEGLRVYGEAWWGGIAVEEAIQGSGDSVLPFGPYMAACLGVGEVFKAARVTRERFVAPKTIFYSLWNHRPSAVPDRDGPCSVADARLAYALAGVGAVGCIAVHALWATAGISGDIFLADADEAGIDLTNLNRYLLFGRTHVGQRKASAAKQVAYDSGIQWREHSGPLEGAPGNHRRILCAVDTNEARRAMQALWPSVLLMASTRDLRAEVVRCDPRNGGPCARCYNAPENEAPDVVLRKEFLHASADEQRRLAHEAGIELDDALTWAATGECGTAGERVRDRLRANDGGVPLWTVPFVSCAAGTMLAAEAVKEALGATAPLNIATPRATIQFWLPDRSLGAKPYQRDSTCPMCAPGSMAADIWGQRVTDGPTRI